MKKFLFILLFLVLAAPASATTYCVSSGFGAGAVAAGNDSNTGVGNGSTNVGSTCWQSLQRATNTGQSTYVHSQDTLIVRGGEYDTVNGWTTNGSFSAVPNGADWSHTTTIQGYSGERPVFRRFIDPSSPYSESQIANGIHLPTPAQCGPNVNGLVNYPCLYGGGSNQCGYTIDGSNGVSGQDNPFPGSTYAPIDGKYYPTGNHYCFLPWQADYPGVMGAGVLNMIGGMSRYIIFDNIDIDARGIVVNGLQLTCFSACPDQKAGSGSQTVDVPAGDPGDIADLPKHIRFTNGEIRNSVNSCTSTPGYDDPTIILDVQYVNMKIHHCGVPYDSHYYNDSPTQGLAREHNFAHYYHGLYGHGGGVLFDHVEAYKIAGSGTVPSGFGNTIRYSYDHDNTTYLNYGGQGNHWSNNVHFNVGFCNGVLRPGSYGDHTVQNSTFIAGPKYTNPPSLAFSCVGSTSAILMNDIYSSLIENNLFIDYDFPIFSDSQLNAQGCWYRGAQAGFTQCTNGNVIRNNWAYSSSNNSVQMIKLAGTDSAGRTVTSPITSNNTVNVNPSLTSTTPPYITLNSNSPLRGAGTSAGYPGGPYSDTANPVTITDDFLGNPQPETGQSNPTIGAFTYCSGGGCATPGTTAIVHVYSANPSTGVSISYTVSNGSCNIISPQSTTFSMVCDIGATIVLTAPSAAGVNFFLNWVGSCNVTTQTCTLTNIQAPQSVTAQYGGSLANYQLTVQSQNPSSVAIACSPLDNNGQGSGSAPFTRIYSQGTVVTCTAPATDGSSNTFYSWTGADQVGGTGNRTATITIGHDSTMVAAYSIGGVPGCGVIKNLPNGTRVAAGCDGFAHNVFDAANGTVIGQQPANALGTIVGSPTTISGITWQQITFDNTPSGWQRNDFLTIAGGSPTTFNLTVASSNPASGVSITNTSDINGKTSGATSYNLTYNQGTSVTLTAPSTAGGNSFIAWSGCDSISGLTCTIAMVGNASVTANYASSGGGQCNQDKALTAGQRVSLCGFTNMTSGTPDYNYLGCQLAGAQGTVLQSPVQCANGTQNCARIQWDQNHQQTNANGFDCTSSAAATNIGVSSRLNPIPLSFSPTTATLTVVSAPNSGTAITITPTDNNAQNNGTTQFTRVYNTGTQITATAPNTTSNQLFFNGWTGCDPPLDPTSLVCLITLSTDKTITAAFVPHVPLSVGVNMKVGASTSLKIGPAP